MRKRLMAAAGIVGVMLVAALGCGCGGAYYAASVNGAASRLEQARQLGAETLAPYEYYYAKAHLEQAEVEASEASYGDAAHYAETAEEFAQKAVELSQSSSAAPGAGRATKGSGQE